MTMAPEALREPNEVAAERVNQKVLLLNELYSLANNNARFRRGVSDRVGFQVEEGDRVEDSEMPESTVKFAYTFSAVRYRNPEFAPTTRFEFSIVGRHENIELPGHIAEASMGLPAEEAIRAGGFATLECELKFNISTYDRILNICESYTYLDEDGDMISYVSSSESKHEGLMYASESYEDEDFDMLTTSQQFPHTQLRERLRHEPLVMTDAEEAQQLWSAVDSLNSAIESENEVPNQITAREVLSRIKQALLVQAGVK
jgi:hypothetical protein